MKIISYVPLAALAAVACFMTSCATTDPQASAAVVRPKYHDAATTDMILQFNRWDTIHMLKPDSREGGFLPIYARDDIVREVKRRNVTRNTAAVVISLFYKDPVQLAQLSQEWTGFLNEQGFRRVVVLHAGPGNGIDGLPVLSDSASGVSVASVSH